VPGLIDKLKACSTPVARVRLTLNDASSVVLELEGTKGKWQRLARVASGYQWRRAEALSAEGKTPIDAWDRDKLDDDEATGKEAVEEDTGPSGEIDRLFKICAGHVRELRGAEQRHEAEIIKAQNDLINNFSRVTREQAGTTEQAIRALRRAADSRPPQYVAVQPQEPEQDAEPAPPAEPGIFDLLEWAGKNPDKLEAIADMLERFGFVRRAAAETVPAPKARPAGVG